MEAHLRAFEKALAYYPDMILIIDPSATEEAQERTLEGIALIAHITAHGLLGLRQQCARLIVEEGLPFSSFDKQKWIDFFLRISGGRFDGLGDRRRVAGPLLDLSSTEVTARVEEGLRKCECICLTVDGFTYFNAKGVCNVMACAPTPFLLGILRIGVDASSAANFFSSRKAALPDYLTNPTRTEGYERGPVSRSPRLPELAGQFLSALFTKSASFMRRMGLAAAYKGLVLFSYFLLCVSYELDR